jgi:hypothetical protein
MPGDAGGHQHGLAGAKQGAGIGRSCTTDEDNQKQAASSYRDRKRELNASFPDEIGNFPDTLILIP